MVYLELESETLSIEIYILSFIKIICLQIPWDLAHKNP